MPDKPAVVRGYVRAAPYENLCAAIIRSAVAESLRPIHKPSRRRLANLSPHSRSWAVCMYNAAIKEQLMDRAAISSWCQNRPNMTGVVSRLREEFSVLYAEGREITLLPEYLVSDEEEDCDEWAT